MNSVIPVDLVASSVPPTLAKIAQGWGTLSCDGVGKKRNSEATGSAIKQVPPLRFASVGMTGFGDW
jgi:hypothetical protein